MKHSTKHNQFQTRAAVADITPTSESDTFIFDISTSSIDRHESIVDAEGLDSANYLKNPVVLFNHISDSDILPVGKCLELTVSDAKIVAKTLIHGLTELSADVLKLVRSGFLKAASIGFIPKNWETMPNDIIKYTQWELLEYSIVNIPANPSALINNGFIGSVAACVEKGIFNSEDYIIKHIARSISYGVTPQLKKVIEQEIRGSKFNLSIKRAMK